MVGSKDAVETLITLFLQDQSDLDLHVCLSLHVPIFAIVFFLLLQIIHRYIRARSIYLSDNLVAKVGDFDFAMLEEDYSVAKEHRRVSRVNQVSDGRREENLESG